MDGGLCDGPDRVEARLLEQRDAAFLGAIERHGPERAVVVMHAAAVEDDALAVEFQPLLRGHADRPNADGGHGFVRRSRRLAQGGREAIQRRRFHRPKPRRRDVNFLGHNHPLLRGNLRGLTCRGRRQFDGRPVRCDELLAHLRARRRIAVVDQRGLNLQDGLPLFDRRLDVNAALRRDVERLVDVQPNVAIDP